MSEPPITLQTTVREVMTRYPGAARIFDKYGLTGCGGPQGPVEPIGWFARAHEVDPDALLAELNEFLPTAAAHLGPEPAGEDKTAGLYRRFVYAAIAIALTLGCTLGATNLTFIARRQSFDFPALWWWTAHVQVHGHAQILGWVGLFIMGVSYHVLPHLKAAPLHAPRLAAATLWLVLAGLLLRAFGQPYIGQAGWAASALLGGALLELIGVSAFGYIAARMLTSGDRPAALFERFLWAGAAWFWVQAAVGVAIASYLIRTGQNAIPAALNNPYLHLELWGFIAFFILGISLRTLPVFMGLREPNAGALRFSFGALNLGLVLDAGGQFLGAAVPLAPGPTIAAVGAVLEFAAVLAFVLGLHLFRRPAHDISAAGVPRGYEKFVRVAYAWLLVAAVMTTGYTIFRAVTGETVGHAALGAYRHAITVGFISMMILGMASRLIPVFHGVPLYRERLLDATFALVNGGNLLRVGFQAALPIFGVFSFAVMGVSGWLEVAALVLFAVNVIATIRTRPETAAVAVAAESLEIGPETRVGPVLERYPETLQVFLRHGFVQLQNPVLRSVMAAHVTIAQACRIHPTDMETLLAELREAAGTNHQPAGVKSNG